MFNCIVCLVLLSTISSVYADLQSNENLGELNYLQAVDNLKAPLLFDQLQNRFSFRGYVRAGYIQTDHLSATALGAELGFSYQLSSAIDAHLGIFATIEPGVNSNKDENIQGEFFNSRQDSYLIVGEAFLSMTFEPVSLRLGRQHFDSPHIDGDDLRIIPNLYEAYQIHTHFLDQLSFGVGLVREVAGWENGANASQFVSIGEALGGEESEAWFSSLSYEDKTVSADSWFYYIPDHLTLFYSELIVSHALSENLSYRAGLQYDWGKDQGGSRLGKINAHTWGVMLAISWVDYVFTVAINKNSGDTSALASVGGGPFFTSVEDQTLDAVDGDAAEAIMLSLDYHFNEYIDVGVMAGKFSASNKNDYNKEELNVFINLNLDDCFDAELMYALVDDLNSDPDLHQIRVIATYHY